MFFSPLFLLYIRLTYVALGLIRMQLLGAEDQACISLHFNDRSGVCGVSLALGRNLSQCVGRACQLFKFKDESSDDEVGVCALLMVSTFMLHESVSESSKPYLVFVFGHLVQAPVRFLCACSHPRRLCWRLPFCSSADLFTERA